MKTQPTLPAWTNAQTYSPRPGAPQGQLPFPSPPRPSRPELSTTPPVSTLPTSLPYVMDILATWLLALSLLLSLPGQAHPKHWGAWLLPKQKEKSDDLNDLLDPKKRKKPLTPRRITNPSPLKRPKSRHGGIKQPQPPKPTVPLLSPLPEMQWYKYPPYKRTLRLKLPAIEVRDAFVLNDFFKSLKQTKAGEQSTRITFYGDSMILQDYVVGPLRRMLQTKFGDAGHGYLTPTSPWPEYKYTHNNVYHYWTGSWRIWRLNKPRTPSDRYGLNGCVFAAPKRAFPRTYFGTTSAYKKNGRTLTRAEVWFEKTEDEADIDLWYRAVGKKAWLKRRYPTQGKPGSLGVIRLKLPEGRYRFMMRPRDHKIKLYGIHLHRDKPGVILDSAGLQGAVLLHLRAFDKAHWIKLLKRANTKLLLSFFGANDADLHRKLGNKGYRKAVRVTLRDIKEVSSAVGSSCMVLGPADRGIRYNGKLYTWSRVKRVRKILREEVLRAGCAFWDTLEAMGGYNSIRRWRAQDPPLMVADLTHFNARGASIIATQLYNALMNAFEGKMQRVSVTRDPDEKK